MTGIFFDSQVYALVVLPLLIFFARVLDVGLSTIRILFISKGFRLLAPAIGFFEALVWLLALGQVFQNLNNAYYYIVYAAGFAGGTLVGMLAESKLSLGVVVLQVVTKRDAAELVDFLKEHGYLITAVDAENGGGEAKIVYIMIQRVDAEEVVDMVKKHNPEAFYSIQDIGFTSEKIFQHKTAWYKKHHLETLRFFSPMLRPIKPMWKPLYIMYSAMFKGKEK